MRSRLIYRNLLALLALVVGIQATSLAAVQNRITSAVQESSRVSLSHTVSPRAARATDLGAAPSSRKLENLTMRFSMTDAQQAALSQLLIDQQNPASPRYRQWLTPQQFGAQFGLSAADIAKVSSWLTAQGFTITGTANSSTFVTFSGTVGQAQQAFGTSVHSLLLGGEQHIANLTEPSLPAAIAGVVSEISGLDDLRLKPHARVRKVSVGSNSFTVHPKDTIEVTNGDLLHFISPGDFATIYNLNPLFSSSINGSGITIAVMGQVDLSSYLPTDVATFRVASGLSVNTPIQQLYGSNPGAPTAAACNVTNPPDACDDLDESELDVEWAGSTAPSSKIVFVTSTDVIGISLVNAIDNNLAPIMTVSYGGCEVQNFSATSINALNQYFMQANAQGITIVGPAGDAGATDCDPFSSAVSQTIATHGLAVDFPASSPNVTGVGGTEFIDGADTTGTYWNNTVNPSTGLSPSTTSARGYIPEMVWNDTTSEIAANSSGASLSAGGGGASVIFTKPTWQTGLGVPADGHRDVPDVSFSASAEHDAYLVCALNSCTNNTYFEANGFFNAFGGTSVSTPAFAGILALVEQKLGTRIGNANPYIYALANSGSYSSIFHDVTTGDNKSPCTIGSTGCSSSPIGFSAGVGYDQASGWGSVDANQFAGNFSAVVGSLPSATTLSVSSSPSAPALGQTVTLTATIAHTSGAAIPTGTVLFTVDSNAAVSETVNSSGIATFTTSFGTSGTHYVKAVYSGDGNYYGANVTTTLTAGTPPTGSFSLSASPATITVANAGSISSTVTIKSVGGYAGTVNLTSTATTINGSYTFLATSSTPTCSTTAAAITLASGASGTCTFTVNSITPATKGGGGLKPAKISSTYLSLGGAVTLASLFFGFSRHRRKRLPTLFSLLALAALITGAGCGGSSSTVAPTGGGTATSSGTYTITIIGTDSFGTITANTTLAVTIQ